MALTSIDLPCWLHTIMPTDATCTARCVMRLCLLFGFLADRHGAFAATCVRRCVLCCCICQCSGRCESFVRCSSSAKLATNIPDSRGFDARRQWLNIADCSGCIWGPNGLMVVGIVPGLLPAHWLLLAAFGSHRILFQWLRILFKSSGSESDTDCCWTHHCSLC